MHGQIARLISVLDVPEGTGCDPGNLGHLVQRPLAFEAIRFKAFPNVLLVMFVMHAILVMQRMQTCQEQNEGFE